MNNDETYTPCTSCGRPMRYCKGNCCGKTKGCHCQEYGPKVCGAIRPGEPNCPYQAIIPSLTVESVSNLKDLADCFVHVSDINTTFYIDDKHRIMTTWAGLVSVEDYDFDANPLNLRSQIAYDAKNNVAAIYDKQGANFIFQISDINNDYMLLSNKPSINGVELSGNKTAVDLGVPDVDEVALVFDTVADMKSATNLVDGGYARTLGFHSINDGGGATYRISNTGTANEMDVIAVGSLFANLVIENTMTVNQFGAYGDGTHDDAAAIRVAVNSDASVVQFVKGSTYMVTPYNGTDSHGILIPSNTTVDLCESTVKAITNDRTHYKIFSFRDVSNSCIKNGTIIGDVDTHTGTAGEWGYGVSIIHCEHIALEKLYITKCWGDGININFANASQFESNGVTIRDCICDDNRRQGMSIEAGNNIYVENCKFINTGQTKSTAPASGVDVEPLVNGKTLENITFRDCTFKGNRGIQLVGTGGVNHPVIGLTVDHCIIDDTNTGNEFSLFLIGITDLKITNSDIGGTKKIVFVPSNDMLFKNNTVSGEYVNVRMAQSQNSTHTFSGNTFYTLTNKNSSIGFLQNYDNAPNTNQNNTLVIRNNKFIGVTSGDYVYSMIINMVHRQGVDKVIIEGNYIQGGKSGITVSCSSIIKNNVICGQTEYGISIVDSIVSGTEAYHDIEDNNFQNCGNKTSIVWNYYKKNLVLRNNTYYPIYFNAGIGAVDYPKSTFTTYTSGLTGYTLIENNNIIALTS